MPTETMPTHEGGGDGTDFEAAPDPNAVWPM
jgi:hypothetical protein